MITKYMQKYFCIDTTVSPAEIWRYDEVVGFSRKVDAGLVYYDKLVDLSEVDEILNVGFSVEWDGEFFFCFPNIKNNTAYLRTWNKSDAEQHGLVEEESDRGMVFTWYRVVPLDECTEFRFHTTVYHTEYFTKHENDAKTSKIMSLPRDEWVELYRKTVYELTPQNYC